ncbi:DUF3566 domain-containing protein [Micromonospora sp. WMMD1102]|uniref:DUF3566 domain-containing protein n=1 Tax=Micromonospora sp. WMMD1102 TaxID=3016105 RepID=UPI0024157BCB|nr:DUF3566 domain-containing protein [Micromonospora sp. WMMD1102]MDG4790949.1 DUF3566 domain-containing protein [Micromonospora sp. WMMD1102]
MTDTQAKSGAAGTSANPVDEESAAGGNSATGRAAVGRAMVSADTPSPKFTRAPGMPPPPDQLPEESTTPSAGAGEDGKPAAATTEAATAATSPAATVAASRGSSGVNRSDQAGSGDPNVTSRLEQPGSASRTERIPGRTERPGSPGTTSGAEATQRIGAASQSAFRPGGSGGSTPTTQTAATSRFGLGSPAARTATGTGPGGVGPGAVGGVGQGTAGGAGAVGAARVTEAVRAARSTVSSAASRGPRRARLNLKRIDPWSVMKFSFAVSLVLFIVVIVATSVLYLALDAMGVFDSVNGTLTDMISASGGQTGSTFQITAKGVILTSGLIGLVNVVLFTALATLGAFIYNVCADLVGGVELTLAERD